MIVSAVRRLIGKASDPGGPATPPPAHLVDELAEMVQRCAAAGRPLDPPPLLELATSSRKSTEAIFGGPHGPPRIRLALDLVDVPPHERSWTLAHELSHLLHRQEARPLARTGPLRALVAAVIVVALILVGRGVWLIAAGDDQAAKQPLALAVLAPIVLLLVMIKLMRREEAAADLTAAEVFGEVLTPAGVQRLVQRQGIERFTPMLLRTHPRAPARRASGLAALSTDRP